MKFIVFQAIVMNSDISDAIKCTLSNDMGKGWKGVTCKNNRRPTLVSNQDFLILDSVIRIVTPVMPFVCTSRTHKERATCKNIH